MATRGILLNHVDVVPILIYLIWICLLFKYLPTATYRYPNTYIVNMYIVYYYLDGLAIPAKNWIENRCIAVQKELFLYCAMQCAFINRCTLPLYNHQFCIIEYDLEKTQTIFLIGNWLLKPLLKKTWRV